jgi:hypothetical protein
MTPCTRCGALTDTTPAADGLLHTCARCTPQAMPCDPGTHVWHGSTRPGVWACWRCGALLPSQGNGEPTRDIPQAPALDYDC